MRIPKIVIWLSVMLVATVTVCVGQSWQGLDGSLVINGNTDECGAQEKCFKLYVHDQSPTVLNCVNIGLAPSALLLCRDYGNSDNNSDNALGTHKDYFNFLFSVDDLTYECEAPSGEFALSCKVWHQGSFDGDIYLEPTGSL